MVDRFQAVVWWYVIIKNGSIFLADGKLPLKEISFGILFIFRKYYSGQSILQKFNVEVIFSISKRKG